MWQKKVESLSFHPWARDMWCWKTCAKRFSTLKCEPGLPPFPTVTKTLTFKTRVSAKSLWCKGVLFAWDEYEIFFKPIASHLASLWHWALGELSNCQFSFYRHFYLFPSFYFSLVFQHVGQHKNPSWTRLPERRKNKSPAGKISLLQQH